jgi:hypothetical protein
MSDQIPGSLLAGAYLAQNGEAAWNTADALKVIAWAAKSHVPILGVEVWLPTTPGPTIPTPYIYTFEPKSVLGESREPARKRLNTSGHLRGIAKTGHTTEWNRTST